jgi:RND family efflux transporter MFP subunit
VVLRRAAEPGENISAGATVLVVGSRGAGPGNVLEVGLADRDAVSVRKGDPALARFDAMPGREFAGRVVRIGAAADPVTGTYEVEIALDDAGELAAGLVGRAEIRPARGAPATLVPIEAVLEADGAEATVYALSADGTRAERRRVTVGFIDGSRVAVAAGLEGATRVLTDGAAYLDDGAAVRVAP